MKMLINSTRAEQLRVAVVDGTTLHEYQVQIDESGLTRGNIYRGVVANIQPSLNAAFIDIGEERHGFLPVGDVLESAYQLKPPKKTKRPSVDQVLQKGQPILVQVTKDGVGQKGAALTTNIALAGRYLVLTPFDGVRGISRKAEDDKDRKTIKGRLKKLDLPAGHGVIVRTNGIDQNQATLNRDMNALLRLWRKVQSESNRGKGPRLLYSDQDLVVQALRDYLDPAIEQVVVDSDEVYEKAADYMKAFMPRSKTKLVQYDDSLPLFSRYRLETQIDKIYDRTAPLPSGGSIVIDLTEALTAIDVNSGRATRNSNHEDSIFKINCEAAKEVARQLRLRDIGGLVVVDFIDMRLRKHQARLERVMRDAMKPDKARYSVGRISPNGLLEINRQRIKQSLRLRTHRPCPTCSGQATIPTPEFAALRLLSRIEGRAASGRVKHVTVALHPEMADMLQNQFRRQLMGIEQDHEIEVQIVAASTLHRTEERLEWEERSDEEARARQKSQKKEPAFSSTDLTAESRRRSRRGRKKDSEPADSPSSKPSRQASEAARDEDEQQPETQQKSKSRRRRSRRRKKDQEVPEAQETAQSQEAQTSQDDGDEASGGTRKRRRRRGGRGRRGRRGEDAAASSEPQNEAREERASDPAEIDKTEEAAESASAPRRRRSRRRSSRRREAEGAGSETSAQDDVVATSPESDDSDHRDADAEPKVVRRRRRSRRANSEDAPQVEEAPESRQTQPSDGDSDNQAQPEAGTQRRRRRSRSSGRRSTAGASVNEGQTDERPEAAPGNMPPSDSASGDSSPEASMSSDSRSEDAEPVRRRRSRSRSRSRAASADPSNGSGGETPAEPTDSGSQNGDREQPSSSGDDTPQAEPSPSPVGVLAGQSAEPKPKKRRWAWWGGPSDPAPDPNQDN
ncbi:MAG: Rne/Rng family ribonuclease [Thermoanaerobaculia bacterium]|nr:Rne/Rng family ribonuclease [Thermoanaerobaculia bacterium]